MKLSARLRLSLFFSILFGILLLSSFMVFYVLLLRGLQKDFRNEMIHDGRIIAELFKEEFRLGALEEFKNEIDEFGIELQVLDKNRKVTIESEGWNTLGISLNDEIFEAMREKTVFTEFRKESKKYLLFSRPVHLPGIGDYSLHILRDEENLQEIPNKMIFTILILLPLLVLSSATAGYIFSSRTLEGEKLVYERLKNFTADAAHELRIPLTSLRGNLEVALRKDRSVGEYKEALENALDEAEGLSQLTQDLLILAQSDSGQIKLNIHKVNLNDFLAEVFAQIKSLPNDKKIHKKLEAAPNVIVRFDPDRMRQVLFNLTDNAIRYGIEGGEVTLSGSTSGNKVKFTVRDNGIGISADEHEKIFQRFYRVDKVRSREQGGVGLGLAIVRSIVNAHRGDIQVKSEMGKGSTFIVTLPMNTI